MAGGAEADALDVGAGSSDDKERSLKFSSEELFELNNDHIIFKYFMGSNLTIIQLFHQ